jgi:hypothetical protein
MAMNLSYHGDDVCTAYSDFIGVNGTALRLPFVTKDQSAAGAPTLGHATGTLNGELLYQHAADNENEIIGVTFGDAVCIPATAGVTFEARVKLAASGGAWASTRRAVIGLAAAHNNDLDAIAQQAWFLVGNAASFSLFVESDDGTTNTDDQDTGETIDDDEYHTYQIMMDDTSNIKFVFDGVVVGETSASDFTSSHLLQPYIVIEKDSGTTTDSLEIDYCRVTWRRDA